MGVASAFTQLARFSRDYPAGLEVNHFHAPSGGTNFIKLGALALIDGFLQQVL
jgi:hypothetical protein